MRMIVLFRILPVISLLLSLPHVASARQIHVEIDSNASSYHNEFCELYSLIQSHAKEKVEHFEKLYSEVSAAQTDLNNWWTSSNGLVNLSDRSRLNPHQGINAHDYFFAVRSFEAKVESTKQKINELKVILTASEFTESHVLIMPQLEKILSPIKNSLQEKQSQAEALSFMVHLPNSEIKLVTGINLADFSDIKVSAEQIRQLKNKEARLRKSNNQENQIITNYNRYILREINTYINAFGESQRYRRQNTPVVEQAKKNLIEAFWTRSFLRKTFGMKLSSFNIEYQKSRFHWDLLPSWLKAKPQVTFGRFISADHELTLAEDQGYLALESLSGTSMNVLKDEVPQRNPLAQFSCFITGKRQELNAKAQVLALILADIREEHKLSRQGGLKELAQSYADRYYDANEAYFRNLQSNYLGEAEEDDIFSDVDTIEASSLKGQFQLVVSSLEAREQRIEEANHIKEYIASLTKNSKSKAKREKRQAW